jgi:NTE family protein
MPSGSEGRETFAQLTPEIIGTKFGELVTRCSHYQKSPKPPPPTAGFPVAVALSGGGFRATLAGIGVLRFLSDAALLHRVRHVSSVSGGSIANAMLAVHYPELSECQFSSAAFAELVEDSLIRMVSDHSLTTKLVRNMWRLIGPKSRTTLLADALDDWFFGGLLLHELPPPCRYVFNAANLTTGVRFGFEREYSGDYVLGRVPSQQLGLRLADAVAMSAAVPGLLATSSIRADYPCANGRVAKLVDGGAYENTALEPVDHLPDHFLIAINAGGIFRTGPIGWIPIVRDLQRSEALLYRQSTGLRMLDMVRRFKLREDADESGKPHSPEARWGVLFGLATTIRPGPGWPAPPFPVEEQLRLAQLKTSFGRFSLDDCRKLIRQAWWLTGATISAYHSSLLPQLPEWRDWN